MTVQFIQGFAGETLWLILLVAAPAMLAALVVGLIVSIFQATTQINEMTLAYIPKMVAIYLIILAFSGFMISRVSDYTTKIFSDFTRFTQ